MDRSDDGRKGGICGGGAEHIRRDSDRSPPDEHNEAIEFLHAFAQGMQYKRHDMDELAQANTFFT